MDSLMLNETDEKGLATSYFFELIVLMTAIPKGPRH
jgi:hypothetical protein